MLRSFHPSHLPSCSWTTEKSLPPAPPPKCSKPTFYPPFIAARLRSAARGVDITSKCIRRLGIACCHIHKSADYLIDRSDAGCQANACTSKETSMPSKHEQEKTEKAQRLVSLSDLERLVGLEFIRATEAAALSAYKWMGKGDKESGDFAACDAI